MSWIIINFHLDEFWYSLSKFYFILIDQWLYEEGRDLINLIHLLSLVRPSFLKYDKKQNFISFISEFWEKLARTKIGLENLDIKLKFCQLLSTFNKWNNIIDVPYHEMWLSKIHRFTIELLEKSSWEFSFSWIRYIITFWEQLTYKSISKTRASIDCRETIIDVFKNYICYLSNYDDTDGFSDSVPIEEKLEPISVLAKVDIIDWIYFMNANLETVENKVKDIIAKIKDDPSFSINDLEYSAIFDRDYICKASWLVLASGELLKADQKVLHSRVLQSLK